MGLAVYGRPGWSSEGILRRLAEGGAPGDPSEAAVGPEILAAIPSDHLDPASVCRDPSDDYLIALARSAGVPLIGGDKDLTSADLADTPRAFCERVGVR